MLTEEQISNVLSPFLIHVSSEQSSKIREYVKLLLKWNSSLSLTSIVDPIEIITRHFGESMYASTLMPVENGRLADVGTGAGFPGLAIKIISPQLRLSLIESNKKKCAFLSEVVRTLGLGDVEILPIRFEEIRSDEPIYNYVTARALGGFPGLLRWAKKSLLPRGHVILWMGGEDATQVSTNPDWIWQPAAKIPGSQRRFILIGRPRVES
jgi:16S rRNA (guanine527-N7)-methyltransferase